MGLVAAGDAGKRLMSVGVYFRLDLEGRGP